MLFLHAVHSKSTPVSKVGVMCSLRSRSLLKRTAAERKDPFFPLLPLKTKQNKTSFFSQQRKFWSKMLMVSRLRNYVVNHQDRQ